MLHRPHFIGSEIYRRSRYGAKHPLAIPRVSAAIDLCRALGWLADEIYIDSPIATPAQLLRFHTPDYIAALQRAEAMQAVDAATAERHGLGRNGNPVFGEIFRRPATACGATLKAVELLCDGGIVFSPAGGTHHGRPDRASGFCYLNDPALGILAFLDAGIRPVYYVDIDAHHGDGVEEAFAGHPDVLTVSVHQEDLWPRTGRASERRDGSARNLPVPRGFHDGEMALICEQVLVALGQRLKPQAVVLQCGTDALADDPMSQLELSNAALWRVVAALRDLAPRLLVLGGGGYNPWSVARGWAGVWATLNRRPIPGLLPEGAQAVLRGLDWQRRRPDPRPEAWYTTLADRPSEGPVRPAIRDLIETVMAP